MRIGLLILCFLISNLSFAQQKQLVAKSNSPLGVHSLYHPLMEGLPIFNQFIKVNQFESTTNTHFTESDLDPIDRTLLESDTIFSNLDGYLISNNQFIPVKAVALMGVDGKSYSLYIDETGNCIHHVLHNHNAKDTIVGTVFMPDPITSSGNSYGPPYADQDDASNTELENELNEVFVKATFEGGVYKLKNEYLKISNHSSPNILPTELSDSIFKFDRSQNGFEEMQAMYHISNFAKYLKDTLGFTDLMNYAIDVDVYALNGTDQSEFISSTIPPRLNFGQGGVDDAEDADVIIHEYSHAVSHSAAEGSLVGYHRLAMDEGLGDYWAAVYSKRLSPNNYKLIFNWDGHNEFWGGRTLEHERKFSDGLDGNKYIDGELFAATLMDIRNSIDDSIADILIMQSVYSWFPNMTMQDAMTEILKADTLQFDKLYSPTLEWIMCNRGFLGDQCLNAIEENNWSPVLDYSLLNDGYLKFENLFTQETISVFSVGGQLILEELIQENTIDLNGLSSGIYIIRIKGRSIKVKL